MNDALQVLKDALQEQAEGPDFSPAYWAELVGRAVREIELLRATITGLQKRDPGSSFRQIKDGLKVVSPNPDTVVTP